MSILKSELKTFQYFIDERERIRLARMIGDPPPWTNDPIMRNWRFCCIRRDHDRTSVYIHSKIRRARLSAKATALACLVARRINSIPTLDAIGFPKWDRNRARRAMSVMHANGQQVFGGAYMMMGGVNVGGRDAFRPLYDVTIDDIIEPARDHIAACVVHHSLGETWRNLQDLPNLGTFMAGQVAMDMHAVGLINPTDLISWAPLGPGSKFGLNDLYGRDKKAAWKHADAVDAFRELYASVKLPKTVAGMPLYDIEHCVCEFYSYRRGHSKRRYHNGGSLL